MEQIDLNQIKLEDTGIFLRAHCSFGSVFKRYQITAVGQVLNDDLMNEVMKHCRIDTRVELRGFISLLKFKYLGIPLINDIDLDSKTKDYNLSIILNVFGLSKRDNHIIYYRYIKPSISGEYSDLIREAINNSTVIELFKILYNEIIKMKMNTGSIGSTEMKRLMEKLELIIESYDKSKHLTQTTSIQEAQLENKTPSQQEHDILVILKDQLVKLVDVRDSLDAQIEDLQQKIDALTNSKTEGGVSK